MQGSKGNLKRRREECLLKSADMHTAALPPTDATIFRSNLLNFECTFLFFFND